MPDCHTRGNAMRINHHIRHHPLNGKGQILLPIRHPTCPLLPMPTRKLIPNLRYPNTPNPDLRKLIAILIGRHKHLIDIPPLRPPGLQRQILIPIILPLLKALHSLTDLPHQHLLIIDPLPRRDNPIRVQLTKVGSGLQPRFVFRRDANRGPHRIHIVVFLVCHVGSVEDAAEHAAFDCRLVDDDAVLLVVAREAGHGDDWVLADGQFVDGDVFGGVGGHEGELWVVEHVGGGVHPQL
jgi:hypothetical protein